MHEGKYKTKAVKSCIRGSVKVLLAFSLLPEYRDHPRCRKLVDYFIRRGGIFRSDKPGALVRPDLNKTSFPVTWRTNIWEILLGLSRMGFGNIPELLEAWKVLEKSRNDRGRVLLDWTPAQCPWKIGKRGKPNRWLTFYTLYAYKEKETKNDSK
jgi:hypothetical protein